MDPFISYLLHVKDLVKNISTTSTLKGLHVIMGNESCDLDSMISALALAYLRYQTNPFVVPIMNIDSHDFALRTENCYILKKLEIDSSCLIFRNTLDLDYYHRNGLLKLSLVDHHVLHEKDKRLESSVVEVFDHRPIDPHSTWTNDVKTVIKRVGSCATLVADEILSYCESKTNIISTSLAVLLYSVIAFDTIAFSIEAGKTTPLDETTASKLIQQYNLNKDTKAVFDELWNAHNDVSHLTPKQLLIKDLKVVLGVPIPGLPMLVEEFLKLPNASNAIVEFCTSRNSSVMIIMGLHVIESKVYRDLAVLCCAGGEVLADAVVKSLVNAEELCLIRVEVELPQLVYFKQQNIQLTRKYILPIIKQVVISTVMCNFE